MNERGVYFNKLSHLIMEAGKSKIWRLGHKAGDLGKSLNAAIQV